MKLTFIVIVGTLIGEPNQFQQLGKFSSKRYNLKQMEVRYRGLHQGQL
jgi:hypothetical protein